jgi:hypothetical protein
MLTSSETLDLHEHGPDPSDRRSFLKIAAAAGLGVAGATLLSAPVFAQQPATDADKIKAIFTVARTAEQLAVTFYSNGIANASALGLTGSNLDAIKAALIEEQVHQQLFTAQGGDSLADTFSFPQGAGTFTDLDKFIQTQQQLEGAFDSAFIAAVKEFAQINRSDLAQIATQIAMIESEHRALGRLMGGLDPADNWAFAPVLLEKVADAPGVLMGAGYLSPAAGNTYKYQQADFTSADLSPVYALIKNKMPTDKES